MTHARTYVEATKPVQQKRCICPYLKHDSSSNKVTRGKDEAAGQMSTALQHLEEAFVTRGQGKDYFGGDGIGYLDIALGSHVGWVKAVEKIAGVRLLDEAKVPNLAAWADRLRAHPAVADAIPDADRFVEFTVKYGSFLKSVNASK